MRKLYRPTNRTQESRCRNDGSSCGSLSTDILCYISSTWNKSVSLGNQFARLEQPQVLQDLPELKIAPRNFFFNKQVYLATV